MRLTTEQNQPYHAKLIGSQVLDEELTKIYFLEFLKRDNQKYLWQNKRDLSNQLVEGIQTYVRSSPNLGIPHIALAFPHITTTYRFGDPRSHTERETNIYLVGRGNTTAGNKINFQTSESSTENVVLGCLIEVGPLLDTEIAYWASSTSVSEYMSKRVKTNLSMIVTDSNKLRKHIEKNNKADYY